MGFHVCEFCHPVVTNRFHNTSSGDVTLVFNNGHSWEMPDMILHYIADHQWLPPAQFVDDVMNHQMAAGSRAQTKSIAVRIGYLSATFDTGSVPDGFVEKLEQLMHQAETSGYRVQYRGK